MKPLNVTVRFEDRVFRAALEYDTPADNLLLKSLYHFGLDPEQKRRYRLRFGQDERVEHGLYLDRSLGEQISGASELVLEARSSDHQRLSTGSY